MSIDFSLSYWSSVASALGRHTIWPCPCRSSLERRDPAPRRGGDRADPYYLSSRRFIHCDLLRSNMFGQIQVHLLH